MTAETARFRVGNLSCVVLSDGGGMVTDKDITFMFARDVERMLAVFHALPAPLAMSVNILLVETAGRRVLIDAGSGLADRADPGQLLVNLRKENIAPESIDAVIITHYHLDHIGGLLNADGQPAFARARLVVPKQEHDHWMSEEFLATMEPDRARWLRQIFTAYAPRLTLMDGTAEIEPGIRYVPTSGHTPGHRAVSIDSQGAHLLHLADMLHVPIQLNAVDVTQSFDFDSDLAIAARRSTIERVVADDSLVMLYHFPFPGLGHIRRTGDSLAWVPYQVPESPEAQG